LSELVSATSRISISPDTLKRLFGKTKTYRSYNPQIETKNALAIFLSYPSWAHFKKSTSYLPEESKKGIQAEQTNLVSNALTSQTALALELQEPVATDLHAQFYAEKAATATHQKQAQSKNYWWIAALFVLLVTLGVVYFFVTSTPDRLSSEKATLAVQKKQFRFSGTFLEGNTPQTAIFNYDISQLTEDSVYIDYGYRLFGYTFKELLPRDKNTITHFYNIPGHYQVSLMQGEQVLSTLEVKMQSSGWVGTVYLKKNDVEIINEKTMHQLKDKLYLSPSQLQSAGIDTNQVNWVEFRNFRDYGVNGDNFVFETRFKNNVAEGGLECLESIFRLIDAEDNLLRLQFIQPGCSRWAVIQFSEIELDGKFADLTRFSTNLSQWQHLKMEVKNKTARVYLEDKLIYQSAYQKPVGPIKGIIYNFRGSGAVDYVKLYDENDQLVYEDHF
jgi:hypothetical protein